MWKFFFFFAECPHQNLVSLSGVAIGILRYLFETNEFGEWGSMQDFTFCVWICHHDLVNDQTVCWLLKYLIMFSNIRMITICKTPELHFLYLYCWPRNCDSGVYVSCLLLSLSSQVNRTTFSGVWHYMCTVYFVSKGLKHITVWNAGYMNIIKCRFYILQL